MSMPAMFEENARSPLLCSESTSETQLLRCKNTKEVIVNSFRFIHGMNLSRGVT